MKKGQDGDHCCRDRTRKPLWILSRQNYSAPPPACRFSKAAAGFSPVWPGSPFFGSCGSDREKTRFSYTRLITAMTLFGRNRLSSRLSLSVSQWRTRASQESPAGWQEITALRFRRITPVSGNICFVSSCSRSKGLAA